MVVISGESLRLVMEEQISQFEARKNDATNTAAMAAAASLQNALLQSANPLPFSINNILHQVRNF